MNNITLLDESFEDGKKQVALRTTSGAVRDAILKCRMEQARAWAKFDKEWKEYENSYENGTDEKFLASIERSCALATLNSNWFLRYGKIIIDAKQLTTEQKAKFDSDVESEFWQAQNVAEIEEAYYFFCDTLKIRRPAN
jgi:hypothetical protein